MSSQLPPHLLIVFDSLSGTHLATLCPNPPLIITPIHSFIVTQGEQEDRKQGFDNEREKETQSYWKDSRVIVLHENGVIHIYSPLNSPTIHFDQKQFIHNQSQNNLHLSHPNYPSIISPIVSRQLWIGKPLPSSFHPYFPPPIPLLPLFQPNQQYYLNTQSDERNKQREDNMSKKHKHHHHHHKNKNETEERSDIKLDSYRQDGSEQDDISRRQRAFEDKYKYFGNEIFDYQIIRGSSSSGLTNIDDIVVFTLKRSMCIFIASAQSGQISAVLKPELSFLMGEGRGNIESIKMKEKENGKENNISNISEIQDYIYSEKCCQYAHPPLFYVADDYSFVALALNPLLFFEDNNNDGKNSNLEQSQSTALAYPGQKQLHSVFAIRRASHSSLKHNVIQDISTHAHFTLSSRIFHHFFLYPQPDEDALNQLVQERELEKIELDQAIADQREHVNQLNIKKLQQKQQKEEEKDQSYDKSKKNIPLYMRASSI
ncbi:MAG: hypothetical protein EZS28_013288 [Streblomastix strix]|uniref:Uncharacterized protein n=1 Tax=Streblomastix strix TaxID=222440 RepID=A0A5J4W969_9EUKA|nr:MAG: hypothetical protein EZS28_013288 [Streblomastix strix]